MRHCVGLGFQRKKGAVRGYPDRPKLWRTVSVAIGEETEPAGTGSVGSNVIREWLIKG